MVLALNNFKVHLENCFIFPTCLARLLFAVDSVLLMCESIRYYVSCFFLNVSGQSVLTSERHSVLLIDKPLSMLVSLLCCCFM